MAKRFSPEFNQEARRIVKSFNQRVRRAEARGMKNLPRTTSVRELKARFTTMSDLKKELSYLRKMNTDKEALARRFLGEGSITNWEFNYIKDNLEEVKTFYDVQIKMAKARYKANPADYGLKQQVINFEARREYLNRNLNKLTYSELKTFRKYLTNYKDYNRRDINYYDRYLGALDELMHQSGVDTDTIKQIRDKINKMPREVFIEMYRRHDVVDEIFQYVPSPKEDVIAAARKLEDEGLVDMTDPDNVRLNIEAQDIPEINRKVNAVADKLDYWQLEALRGLIEKKDMEELTPKEQEMYDKYFGEFDL